MRFGWLSWSDAPLPGHHIIGLLTLALALPLAAADDPLRLNKDGAALLQRGEYDQAQAAFEQSRRLHHERGERQAEAERWVNIGAIHFYRGRYLEAWETYRQADALIRDEDPWAHDVRQFVDINRAALLQKLGRDQDALDIYSLVRRQRSGISEAERAQMLSNLGALFRRLGDPYRALECEREAIDIFRAAADRDGELGALKNIAIAQALDFGDYPAAVAGFQQVLTLATKTANRREVLHARLYLAETHRLAGDPAKAESEWTLALPLARELAAPEEEWKALFGLGRIRHDLGLVRQAAELIEANRSRLSSSLRSGFLAARRDVYDALIEGSATEDEWLSWLERSRGLGAVTASSIRNRLPDDAALLVFWAGPARGRVRWVTRQASGGADISWDRRGKLSMDWLAELPKESRWIIVPDGRLASVSFDSLTFKDNVRVIDRHETWLVPSIAALQPAYTGRRVIRFPWQRQLLGIGDPAAGSLLPGDERWARLPRAAAELAAAKQHLDGHADLLERANARKDALKRAFRYRLVHLATHAAADYENPARSRILFAGPEYLYLRDIAGLDFRGVELITLSACETASGTAARGDAPMSLSRAFLDAGAAATIGTLWPVRDDAAHQFTELFYRALSRGDAKATAVRAAKLAMLRRGAREEDWAAFVLTGDGLSTITPFMSWSQLLSALAGIAIVIGALQMRRR